MPKPFDVNGDLLEIDNEVNLLSAVDGAPAGAYLLIRDIGLAGAKQEKVELICEDTRGGRVFVEPSNVQLIYR